MQEEHGRLKELKERKQDFSIGISGGLAREGAGGKAGRGQIKEGHMTINGGLCLKKD